MLYEMEKLQKKPTHTYNSIRNSLQAILLLLALTNYSSLLECEKAKDILCIPSLWRFWRAFPHLNLIKIRSKTIQSRQQTWGFFFF